MIHEWPEATSNPVGNQESQRRRSELSRARTGLSMHIGNKLAVKERLGARRGKKNADDLVDNTRSFP